MEKIENFAYSMRKVTGRLDKFEERDLCFKDAMAMGVLEEFTKYRV